jgi:hypothetical protein
MCFLEEQEKVLKLEAALATVNQQLKEQAAKLEKVSARWSLQKRCQHWCAAIHKTRCSGARRGQRLHTHKQCFRFSVRIFSPVRPVKSGSWLADHAGSSKADRSRANRG